MAGHSKWANIQHRKKAQDAKRGKLFTKLIREIVVAAKAGGGDVETNPRLRLAVDKALGGNMTRDTIERAIKRGAGDQDGDNYEEIRYEGYGAAGVAVMVDCMTDNRNRTVAEVRHAFGKCGGNLGNDGSVAYLFSQIGVMNYDADADEDAIMEAALEAGAEDILVEDDGTIEVVTTPETFTAVKDAMVAAGHEPAFAEITQRPSTTAPTDDKTTEQVIRLIDMLEDLDDVQNVYTNAEFPESALADA